MQYVHSNQSWLVPIIGRNHEMFVESLAALQQHWETKYASGHMQVVPVVRSLVGRWWYFPKMIQDIQHQYWNMYYRISIKIKIGFKKKRCIHINIYIYRHVPYIYIYRYLYSVYHQYISYSIWVTWLNPYSSAPPNRQPGISSATGHGFTQVSDLRQVDTRHRKNTWKLGSWVKQLNRLLY